jgi:glycosyltransferase involved in cell wall biosynthesis
MKILIVCSYKEQFPAHMTPFVEEQGNMLKEQGLEVDYFTIRGNGVWGYLKNYPALKKKIKATRYDIVHAHFGLSGALAVMQRTVPVVITFHNGETLSVKSNIISSLASLFSAYNIYVAQHIYDFCYFKNKNKSMILPCGIDIEKTQLIPQAEAKVKMNLPSDKINILFGGNFLNLRKNVKLANEALALLQRNDINLIELKGFSREEVNTLLCACDLMLLPTKSEGSPQIVKEAMACNCPIVVTDVADIAQILNKVEGTYLTSFAPEDVAEKIRQAIAFGKRTNGRENIQRFDNKKIVKEILALYNKII